MKLLNLKLINFRNIKYQELDLSDSINLFIGENAQGKTNLLEGLFYMARAKSFRNAGEKELIRLGQRSAYIKATIERKDRQKILEMKLSMVDKKIVKIDSYDIEKSTELTDLFDLVMFSPEDLYLVKGGPYRRRLWIDDLLTAIDSRYSEYLKKYNRALFQRNKKLKGIKNSWFDKEMDALDSILAQTAFDVELSRQGLFNDLLKFLPVIHKELSGNREKIGLKFLTNMPFVNIKNSPGQGEKWVKEVEKILLNGRKEDIEKGYTNLGPHRDDILMTINSIESRKFASQGQARTLALSMKLAELKILEKKKGVRPILLLDDVFSELDENRAFYLTRAVKNYQSLITSNGVENLEKLTPLKVFKVKDGHFKEIIGA